MLGFDQRQSLLNARRGEEAVDARRNDAGNLRHRQLAGSRKQPVGVRLRPFALLVELADDARANILAPVVELFLQLVFDQLPLFLNHQNFFQPVGELAHALRFQRPDHAHLVQADADLGRQRIVDAQFVEGLAHIEVGLAGGDDAQSRRGAGSVGRFVRVDDDAVQVVGAAVGQRGVKLVVQQAALLLVAVVWPADVEAAFRQLEIRR